MFITNPALVGGVSLGWGARRGVGMSPLVFWKICDFSKHVQNVNNVLL